MIKLILEKLFTLLPIAGTVFLATLRPEADHPLHLRLTRRDLFACPSKTAACATQSYSQPDRQRNSPYSSCSAHLLLDSMSHPSNTREIRRANIDGHIWYEMAMIQGPRAGVKYYACKVP
jgi:hypothetical protein